MNQRDSSGLPLRAMVMVLLFLGVVFLLIAFQALGGDGDESDESAATTVSSTITPTTTATSGADESGEPEPGRTDVWVFNTTGVDGQGGELVGRLREGEPDWNVPDADDRPRIEGVDATTVYFTPDVRGQEEIARAVAGVVGGEPPVVPRVPELDDVPPGVVVLISAPPG